MEREPPFVALHSMQHQARPARPALEEMQRGPAHGHLLEPTPKKGTPRSAWRRTVARILT